MSTSQPPAASGRHRLDEVLAEYMERLDRGEAVDRARFLAEHPDVADGLLAYFEATDAVSQRTGAPVPAQGPGTDVESAPTENYPVPPLGEAPPGSTGPAPGQRFGDYVLLGEIAHGGMGVVFKARQLSLNRLVALKLIRAGQLASPTDVLRFRTEAEAAAHLDHPHIVPIYEVGELGGQHFFSMKLIRGRSLAQAMAGGPGPAAWGDSPQAVAQLVATVARAVHHAHQHGILHRDLKPGNILLDEQGQPHVTDFGLAKRFEEDTDLTPTGEIVGTPRYMAPEQASAGARRLTTAADVYGLGAILYELLAGRPPFVGRDILDTLRQVLTRDPTPPSRLQPKVPRDLEVICLKALEKEPRRRYPSAEALADDLERFLAHEPIQARPVAWWEKGVKWVRRNPVLAAFFLVVCVLVVRWVVSYVQVRSALAEAQQARERTRQAADEFYTDVVEEWLESEPYKDPVQEKFLDRALRIYQEFAREESNEPAIRQKTARAWFRVAQINRALQQADKAEEAYNRAIALQERLRQDYPTNPDYRRDLGESYNWLGELLREQGHRLAEAEDAYRQALALQRQLVAEFPAASGYRKDLAQSHNNLGIVQMDTGRPVEARADFDQAIDLLTRLPENDPKSADFRQELARVLINRGILNRDSRQFGAAETDYRRAIGLYQGLLQGVSKPIYKNKVELAVTRNNLANLFLQAGRPAKEAQDELGQALVLAKELVAAFPTRPRYRKKLANIYNGMGAIQAQNSDLAGAEASWKQAQALLTTLVADYPNDAEYHGYLGRVVGNLGWLRAEQKRPAEARPLLEEAVGHLQAALKDNPEHPAYLDALRVQYQSLAETRLQLKDHAAAAEAAGQLPAVGRSEPLSAYFAGCFLARCASVVKQDNRLTPVERQTAADQYADQSLAFLREAVSKGFHDGERLRKDRGTIFGALADRPEFLKLARELEALRPAPDSPPRR